MVDQSRIKFNFITLTIFCTLGIIQFGSGDYVSRHPRDFSGHFHGHHSHDHGEHAHTQETTVGLVPPEAVPLPARNGDVAPHCQCVVKNTGCQGREAYTRLFDGVSTLKCGESFERCCFEDPWPGLVDRDEHILPCVPQEQCARFYGQAPTDVRDFGTLSPCPGAGTVRCIPHPGVIGIEQELVLPPPQTGTIVLPIVELPRDSTPPPPIIPETTPTTPPPETTLAPPTPTPSTPLPPTYDIPPPPAVYEAPKPVETYEAPKPVETYEAPKPVETYEAPKPVETYEAPKPVETYEAPKLVETYEAPKLVETYEAPKLVETYEAPVSSPLLSAQPPFSRPGPPYLWRNLNGFYPRGRLNYGGIGYPYGYGFNFHKRIGFGIGGGFF